MIALLYVPVSGTDTLYFIIASVNPFFRKYIFCIYSRRCFFHESKKHLQSRPCVSADAMTVLPGIKNHGVMKRLLSYSCIACFCIHDLLLQVHYFVVNLLNYPQIFFITLS